MSDLINLVRNAVERARTSQTVAAPINRNDPSLRTIERQQPIVVTTPTGPVEPPPPVNLVGGREIDRPVPQLPPVPVITPITQQGQTSSQFAASQAANVAPESLGGFASRVGVGGQGPRGYSNSLRPERGTVVR